MNFDFNCYIVLEVDDKASTEEIKKAYRKLSKKYYPDNLETGDEELFKKLSVAYSILKNPKKRKLYDLGKWDDLELENEIELTEAEQNIISLFEVKLSEVYHRLDLDDIEFSFLKEFAKEIKESLETEIMEYKRKEYDLEEDINILKSAISKIYFKKEKTKYNLIEMALNQVISLKEQEIRDIVKEENLAEEMLHILEDFIEKSSHWRLAPDVTNKKIRGHLKDEKLIVDFNTGNFD